MRPVHLVAILMLLALTLPASPAHAGGVVGICDEAHLTAALTGGGTVTFSCSGTITLTSTIIIAANTTVDGSGQSVILSGGNAVRLFKVNSGVTLTLDRLTIANAGNSGIYVSSGAVIVRNSTFTGNSAPSGAGGAIILNGGSATISSTTFSGNTSQLGGAIHSDGSTVSVTASSFAGNGSASSEAGAIYSANTTLDVSSSTFDGNSATDGGAIIVDGGAATISNSTLYDNEATNGGGISVQRGGAATVINSTIAGNSAPNGAGIENRAGTVTLKNTLVGDNLWGPSCSGAFVDGGGNLSDDPNCPGIHADPRLGPLQDNGGPTLTMLLEAGSPAIDAANDATCAAAPVGNVDQRGTARPQGSHCDIGALEVTQFRVTKTQDDSGGCTPGDCALREAIIAANTMPGHQVVDVPAGVYQLTLATPAGGQDGPGTGDLDILDMLTVQGDAAGGTIVQGLAGDRIFEIPHGPASAATVWLSHLTIESGSVSGNGGGIVNGGWLTLVSCKVQNNTAGAYGGGVFNSWSLTVDNSTFAGNHAGSGAGIYNEMGMVVADSTFSGNSASTDGGGIYNYSTLNVTGSTFSGNSASRDGGGIHNLDTAYIYDSTFSGNSASGAGGAIRSGYSLTVGNSTVAGNGAGSGGGIFAQYHATLMNTIVANSTAGGSCSGTFTDGGGNLSYPDATCPGVVRNPMLGALQDNGGPTQTMALRLDSGAIDAGNTANCQLEQLNGRDQRGYNRFADGPDPDTVAQCDIGAYEFGSTAPPPAPTLDNAPPKTWIELTPASPNGSHEWYRSPVTVMPQALDASPVIDLRCALDPPSPPAAFDDLPEEICAFLGGAPVSADGEHTFYAAAMDLWGNQSEVVSSSFQIDATPPVITCPAAGPFFVHSGEHSVGPAGVDASVSGLDEAASTLMGVVTTESVGPKTLTFTAVDLAGNSASRDCTYNVIFDFDGFYPPVEPAPALNDAKAGQSVPLKFSLGGDQGLEVIAAGYPASQPVDCDTLEPAGPLVATQPPGNSGLRYAAGNGWYSYGWKTSKEWTGTCRALVAQLVDGTEHQAYFRFR